MEIRKKLIILLTLTLVLLLTLVYLNYYFYFQRKESSISNKTIEKENTAAIAMVLVTESIKNIVVDYTFWDEMAETTLKPDLQWFRDNIDPMLVTAKVHYVWVLNTNDELVHSIHDSSLLPIKYPVPVEFLNQVLDKQANGKNRFCHFFTKMNGQIIEIYGATIHRTNDSKRVNKAEGFFVVGKEETRATRFFFVREY